MKGVIYARYSAGSGQNEQSIEGQLRDCYEYAKAHDITIVNEYIDRHISGTTDERAQFQKMINDSGKKLFDTVIVWKLDRFSRNRYDSAIYKAQLKKNGIKILYAKEAIPEGPEGIILESLLGHLGLEPVNIIFNNEFSKTITTFNRRFIVLYELL